MSKQDERQAVRDSLIERIKQLRNECGQLGWIDTDGALHDAMLTLMREPLAGTGEDNTLSLDETDDVVSSRDSDIHFDERV